MPPHSRDLPDPAALKPGDVVYESPGDGRTPPRRTVFTRRNPHKRSGMDLSDETLRTCDFCGTSAWIKDLARNTKWRIDHVGWFITITACPEHAREALALQTNLPPILRERAQEVLEQVRARMDLPQNPPKD